MIRPILLFLCAARLLCPQSRTGTSQSGFDVNGNPLAAYSAQVQDARGLKRTEMTRSPNGDWIPRRQTEERVVRESGGTRVIERVEQPFGPDGRSLEPRRTVIEETRRADGGSTSRIRVYSGDGNGSLQLVEQATQEVRPASGGTEIRTEILRPDMSGTLSVAERIASNRLAGPGGVQRETTSTLRPDANGTFVESERRVSETRASAQGSDEQLTVYNTVSGQLAVAEQRAIRTTLSADGSSSRVTDTWMPGGVAVASAEGGVRLVQREITEKKANARGGFEETVSVQQPLLNEPGRLGPTEVQSRSSCSGDCLPKTAKP